MLTACVRSERNRLLTTTWNMESGVPVSRNSITEAAASSTEEPPARCPTETSSTARASDGEFSTARGKVSAGGPAGGPAKTARGPIRSFLAQNSRAPASRLRPRSEAWKAASSSGCRYGRCSRSRSGDSPPASANRSITARDRPQPSTAVWDRQNPTKVISPSVCATAIRIGRSTAQSNDLAASPASNSRPHASAWSASASSRCTGTLPSASRNCRGSPFRSGTSRVRSDWCSRSSFGRASSTRGTGIPGSTGKPTEML